MTYWFYLYVVWFFPLVMVALLGVHGVEQHCSIAVGPHGRRRSGSRRALSQGSSSEVSKRTDIWVRERLDGLLLA